jgi:hypothetical protein
MKKNTWPILASNCERTLLIPSAEKHATTARTFLYLKIKRKDGRSIPQQASDCAYLVPHSLHVH